MKINKKFNFLEFLIYRLKKSKRVSQIVIACSKNKKDKKIANLCKRLGIFSFQGSEYNVLDRFYKTAKKFKADIIVRITSDCPFTDPKLIDTFLKIYLKSKFDYFSNIYPRSFPDGLDIEIFNFKTLEITKKKCFSKYGLEHVTPFMIRSKKIKKSNFTLKRDFSKLRITLDNKKDLMIIRKIAENINPKKYFSWKKILPKLKNIDL
jgi:spore coat polysaccharide biosynthesis protein SpsF (cytidylyltransferase family)